MTAPLEINLLHVLFVGPLLTYVAYQRLNDRKIPRAVLQLLLALGVGVMVYHAYLASQKIIW